jgi:hypothetical protein
MNKELKNWYFFKYTKLRTVVYKLNKPLFYDNNFNLCPNLMHEHKPYESFSSEIKKNVEKMLNYMFEILAYNKNEHFIYLVKWFANMTKGNKNTSLLYFKGIEGIGKSTICIFFRDHVIGNQLVLESGSEPIKSQFNFVLAGKLLVYFEELENTSTAEWQVIGSRIKRYTTSDKILIEAKNVNSYTTDNLNNYIVLSNHDALKDDSGRRIYPVDVSTKRDGDLKYWNDLYESCFNNKVGEAFFAYMMEYNTDKYNPQDMPITKNKMDAYVSKLNTVETFLKEEYVREKKSIYLTVDELFEEYRCFHEHAQKLYGKIQFCSKLKDLGIVYYKCNSKNMYKVDYHFLFEKAKKKHWIHELDNIDIDVNVKEPEPEPHVILTTNLQNEIALLKEQLQKQSEEIELYKSQLEQKNKTLVEEIKKPKKKVKETTLEFPRKEKQDKTSKSEETSLVDFCEDICSF